MSRKIIGNTRSRKLKDFSRRHLTGSPFFDSGTYLKVTKELKHDILKKLAETMNAFKAYPAKEDFRVILWSLEWMEEQSEVQDGQL